MSSALVGVGVAVDAGDASGATDAAVEGTAIVMPGADAGALELPSFASGDEAERD